MRRAARVDSNQADLVGLWRSVGVSVQALHAVGKGCPDVLLSMDGLTLTGTFDKKKVLDALQGIKDLDIRFGAHLPVEIKSSAKSKLTSDEENWWKERQHSYGQLPLIVHNEDEALELVGRVFE